MNKKPRQLKSRSGAANMALVKAASDGNLQINLATLTTPPQTYDADLAWARLRRGAVSVFFAKLDDENPERLRSRLEIRYPVEAFIEHLWANSREFHTGLREWVSTSSLTEHDDPSMVQATAEKSTSVWANFEYIARAGSQGAIEFFHLSPAAAARLAAGVREVAVEPIVRVLMTAVDLCRFLDSIQPLVEKLGASQTAENPAPLEEGS